MNYYAHTSGEDSSQWQLVRDHLFQTAKLAKAAGADANVGDFAYISALMHDIGKYSLAFQRRLSGVSVKVDHSTAGAKEALRLFDQNPQQKLLATLLAYCIAGHHGGLPDYGSIIDDEEDRTLNARLKRPVEDYSAYAQEIDVSGLSMPGFLPVRPIQGHPGFSISFFTRMIYSALVDADFLDTERVMNSIPKNRGGYLGINSLMQSADDYLLRFQNPATPIHIKRNQTLGACIHRANDPQGMFSLTVPTGGGKTLSSLAFALHHAQIHGLNRIIYIIPYTSIIEQNAAVFKECLGQKNVLEHHSNFEWKSGNSHPQTEFDDDLDIDALQKLKLSSENWDIPIIVTTNVQFFESLFANRSSRCRKLHNIAKSVIIFDEAQMLPLGFLKPCLLAVGELVQNYRVSAVFCTATQPALDVFLPKNMQPKELAPDPQGLFEFYKRVVVTNSGKLSDSDLIEKLSRSQQVLCIVNTRRHARGLFAQLPGEGNYHLSTLMCPAHRRQTIAAIRKKLSAGQECRVISTQIMEAGIDVDFPRGYRALSGLDSIIQAAGRINREGKNASGELVVFEPESKFVKRTPAYIEQCAAVAKSILRNYDDPICLQAIRAYYDQLYMLTSNQQFDEKKILECFEKNIPGEPNFDFESAAKKFELIQNSTVPVIIPWNQTVKNILNEVKTSQFPGTFSRRLQPYTVNIYPQEFTALMNAGVIDQYAELYSVLSNMEFYSEQTGLSIPESTGGDAIFVNM